VLSYLVIILQVEVSCDLIKENEMGGGGHVARIVRGTYGALMGKPERIRPLGRSKCRCGDNIK